MIKTGIVNRLNGIFGRHQVPTEDIKATLREEISKSDAMLEALNGKHWPIFKNILAKLRDKDINTMGHGNLDEKTMTRINNRLTLLGDIEKEIQVIIKRGEFANKQLNEITEREKRDERE